jgi:hypothetical protein
MSNNIIWKNFSTFWNFVPPESKNIIEQNWEGLKEATDDLYFQLYETNNAKSLEKCPIYTTRRWLLLDLSEENLNSVTLAGQRLLEEDKTVITSKVNLDETIYNTQRAILHKHYRFIYNPTNGLNLTLPFPLDYTTVEIFKSGKILQALVDFRLDLDTNKIIFKSTGEHIVYLSVNHNPNEVTTFYKHKYIKQTSSNGDLNLLNEVNQEIDIFTILNNGSLLNPSQYTVIDNNTIKCSGLSGEFEILWLEEESQNSFIEKHEHKFYEIAFNTTQNKAGSITSLNLPSTPSQSVKSRTEKIFRVFINGVMLEDSEFTINNNLLTFSPTLVYTADEILKIIVEWTDIYPSSGIKNHRHYAYQATNFQSQFVQSTFDDGGTFDSGGTFDTEDEVAELNLSFTITQSANISIWVDGIQLFKNIDYTITGQTIFFNISVNNKNIKISYFENDRIYVYGYENINYPTSKFSKTNLSLFYDETPEYFDKNISSQDANLTFQKAVEINFENINLESIPLILNGVSKWTNQWNQEFGSDINDYELDNGLIRSDVQLPSISWCPIAYFDERNLAQNFGALVNYEQESSLAYKAELANYFRSLWNGPTIQNIKWASSIFLGAPFIQSSSQIEKIEPTLINKTVKTQFESFNVLDTDLLVSNEVKAGQSVASKIKLDSFLNENAQTFGRDLEFPNIGNSAEVGDVLTIPDKQTFVIEDVVSSNRVTLSNESLFPIGLITNGSETLTVSADSIGINVIGFTPESKLNDVRPDMFFKTNNVSYTITTQPAANRIYVATTPTLGSTYEIYAKDAFHIVPDNGIPYFTTNGTVLSIDENIGTSFLFSSGETRVTSAGLSTYLQAGNTVEPFQPLIQLAEVIDFQIDSTWWIDKTEDFRSYPSAIRTFLRNKLYPYERTIEVGSTESFPESGVLGIQGQNSAGFNTYERIFYETKTDTKFINCKRQWNAINKLQFAITYNQGTELWPELEYRKNTVNHRGLQTFRDNTGSSDFTNLESIIPLYAPNVMILSISSRANTTATNIAKVSNFLNRIMERSVKWYLDINVDLAENILINPDEQITTHEIYSISPLADHVNTGRVVSRLDMTVNGIQAGMQINSGDTYANVVNVDWNFIYIDYVTNNTFSIGDVVTVSPYVNTITAVSNYNILYFPNLALVEWQDSLSVGTEYADTLSTGKEFGEIL